MKKILGMVAAAALMGASAAASAQTVNVICSVQADWCNMIATVYARTTGVKLNMALKGSGEALAQLIAEGRVPRAHPSASCSQRAQEVQHVLFRGRRQRIESIDHGIGLRSRVGAVGIAAVRLDCRQQIVSPAVMQEEHALTQAP